MQKLGRNGYSCADKYGIENSLAEMAEIYGKYVDIPTSKLKRKCCRVKTDKYRRLLSCCPSLLDAADKTANDMNEDLQNNIPAQVTAYVTAPVLFVMSAIFLTA